MTKVNEFTFSFDASKCSQCGGKCCTGSSGNIWIKVQDLEPLAKYLDISTEELLQKYVEKRGYRFSLKEVEIEKDNFACIFFDIQSKRCSIYELRPVQCKTFPFWSEFKDDMEYLLGECIGVNPL